MDRNVVETTIQAHAAFIRAIIQLGDGHLCSCSDDDTIIKVWNIESGQCEMSIDGHARTVTSVIQLIDRRLCSGSYDKRIRVWNIGNGVCELSVDTGH
jgi:WD40 repeat protein